MVVYTSWGVHSSHAITDNSQIAFEPEEALLVSPLEGQVVRTTGVVTAVDTRGFYLQDPIGDDDDTTSDALFVYTEDAPTVVVGDAVEVIGEVLEFYPSGRSSRNQPTTEIVSPVVSVLSSGNALPEPVPLGVTGRTLPTESMLAGLNYWESLEAMRVTCVACRAIAPTNSFSEIYAVSDEGSLATGLNSEMGLTITPSDFNPEKIQIDEDAGIFSFDLPKVNPGALLGDVTGVVGYNFGSYEIYPTELFDAVNNPDVAAVLFEIGPPPDFIEGQLTVASYNVLNLDPNDADGDEDVADGRFDAIADHIINGLGQPDIVGLQEIQDNSGSDNDGVVAADVTLQTLVDAIAAAGGITYEFIDNTFIEDGLSGGQPGANIRTAFLYDPDRVSLIDDLIATFSGQGSGEAFQRARLPLVAAFDFDGNEIVVINCHLSSKGGSAPIIGIEQSFEARQEDPEVNGNVDDRQIQASAIADFIGALGDANVVVLGDMNEFQFVSPLSIIEDAGMVNLWSFFEGQEEEVFSYNFQGNAQALDHILVSEKLVDRVDDFGVLHVNSAVYYPVDSRPSDHDPIWMALNLTVDDSPRPPPSPTPPTSSSGRGHSMMYLLVLPVMILLL